MFIYHIYIYIYPISLVNFRRFLLLNALGRKNHDAAPRFSPHRGTAKKAAVPKKKGGSPTASEATEDDPIVEP